MKHVRYAGMSKPKAPSSAKDRRQPAAWCGTCCERIDVAELRAAIADDRRYVHDCGKVLNRGR